MEHVTCQKCAGTGIVVSVDPALEPYRVVFARMRAVFPDEDVTCRRWHRCPTCRGAGVLPVQPRAEVWRRVAEAGIVLDEELREEGDLDGDATTARTEGGLVPPRPQLDV